MPPGRCIRSLHRRVAPAKIYPVDPRGLDKQVIYLRVESRAQAACDRTWVCVVEMEEVDAYVPAAGAGSVDGVRVGLSAVKAWAEVYGKRIVPVSRLEALAAEASGATACVAAFANAQRGQVFGAVYKRNGAGLARLGDEMVIAPGKFVEAAAEFAGGENISWVSVGAECVIAVPAWKARGVRGDGG